MKNIKNFQDFLNEELKHLPPPSDDETDAVFYEMSPQDALEWSINNNLMEYVKKSLMEKGATIERNYHILRINDFKILEYILDSGFDINNKDVNGWTPLMYAAKNAKYKLVKFLLEHGANPNIRENLHGYNSLDIAKLQIPNIFKEERDIFNTINILKDYEYKTK